jgi:lysophospholipase L1-like esterase
MHGPACALIVLSLLLMLGSVAASPAAAERPDTVPGLPVQLALGDSWAAGVGAAVPSEGGYVPRLHAALRERYECLPAAADQARDGCKSLQLVNLAVGGATTPTLIDNQLPAATALLAARNGDRNPRNDVEVTTLHIGGNDVAGPVLAACLGGLTPGCRATLQAELAAYRGDLDTALAMLRNAAGDEAIIAIGTYDNPIPSCQLAPVPGAILLGALLLEGGGPVPQGLHDLMRDVASEYDVVVAETFGDLDPQDWVGGTDCLHPDDSGYEKVAASFLDALGVTD